MTIFSRKTSSNILLLVANLILIIIIGQMVTADENLTLEILEQSTYLYYYESDDQLIPSGGEHIYTFAPYQGENITIATLGLDETALSRVELYDSTGTLVASASTNTITANPNPNTQDPDTPQTPFVAAIQHTANNGGLYYFIVTNESDSEGLIRSMLFVGDPLNTDLTLIDELNPLLPSKAFMVAGDPNREWEDELTGETIDGLRTQVDVQEIERLDRVPEVFTSYSTLSYLPDASERLDPVTTIRWFNEDEEEIYLVNVRPIPEDPTETSRSILEDLDHQTYNSNNFFFFDYFFTIGNGSDPIALDRGAGACAGLADRIDCVANDSNLGREEIATETADIDPVGELAVEGVEEIATVETVVVTLDTSQTCTSITGDGNPVTGDSGTVCVPTEIAGNISPTIITVTTSGTGASCIGTEFNDLISCSEQSDWIEGLGGNDVVLGNNGNDTIFGGDGTDYISGGAGNDTIDGGADEDIIEGDAGNDTINLGGTGGTAAGGADSDTFILNNTNISATLSGGSMSNNVGSADNVQDTFNFDNVTGEVNLYTDEEDLLDFFDFSSGITVIISGTGSVVGTDLTVTIETPGTAPGRISGSDVGNDTITVNDSDGYQIDGNGGADTITTGGGADTIDGGADNDIIDAGNGNNNVSGSAGEDDITTGTGNDNIDGGTENDVINSGDGADTIDGGADDDVIDAGAGDDVIDGGTGNDIITAGTGSDDIDGGTGDDLLTYEDVGTSGVTVTVSSTDGNTVTGTNIDSDFENIETVSGTNLEDTFISDGSGFIFDGLSGTNGDTISYQNAISSVTVDLNAGTGSLSGTSTTDTLINIENIIGTVYDDDLTGTDGDNTIIGLDGDDVIITGNGTNVVFGDDTNNTDNGNDLIITGVDSDTVQAGGGDDTVVGGAGTDSFDGGNGSDWIDYSDQNTTLDVNLTNQNASGTVIGGTGDNTLVNFENISSGSGNDTLTGDGEVNIILGNDGLDTIFGNGGDDSLNGGNDNDEIYGGTGDDTLTGGDGNDYLDGGTGGETDGDFIDESENDNGLEVTLNGSSLGGITDTTASEFDTIINIENINTGDGADTFTINDVNDNIVNAGGGTDTVELTLTIPGTTVTVTRNTSGVVTTSGVSVGNDEYTSIEVLNIAGSGGNDTIELTDSGNNTITGEGGTDTVNVTNNITGSSDTITITRQTSGDGSGSGPDVEVIGTGIGTDLYSDIAVIDIAGSSADETYIILDEEDNNIDGVSGLDTVEVIQANNVTGTITITRGTDGTGNDVTVTGDGIGNDNFANVDQVNISGSNLDDTFEILDTANNVFNGGDGSDTADYTATGDALNVEINVITQSLISGAGTGQDILISIENIITGDGDDTFLIIDPEDNTIDGGGGTNILTTIMSGTFDGVITIDRTGNVVEVSGTGYGQDTYINMEEVNVTSNDGDDTFIATDENNNTFDAGGETNGDTIDYSDISGSNGVVVDLANETATDNTGGSAVGTDTLLNFENISGSDGEDTLTGDTGNNSINANAGDDTINGGDGDDNLTGGTGNDEINGGSGGETNGDTFDESDATTDMVVTLTDGNGTSESTGQGDDTLNDIENVTTGEGDDTFILDDDGDNIINAGTDTNGDTVFVNEGEGTINITRTGSTVTVTGTGIGEDTYIDVEFVNVSGSTASNTDDTFVVDDDQDNIFNGQGGTDSIDYGTGSTDPIEVDFENANTATVVGTSIGTDTLINFEEIATDDGADTITFDADVGDVTINSRDGDDVFDFDSGAAGDLTLIDSNVGNFLDFADYGTGISLSLSNTSTAQTTIGGSIDSILLNGTFTHVTGTAQGDNISGTNQSDYLYGGDGVDSLYGDNGDDTLIGGLGNDYLDGGDGEESLDYSDDNSDATVILLDAGLEGSFTNASESDTLVDIENIDTGDGDDTFTISDSDDNNIDANGNGATGDIVTVEGATGGLITITRGTDGTGSPVVVTGAGIGTDTYTNVEYVNVSGSSTADTFEVLDAEDNILNGLGGDDTIDYSDGGSVTDAITINVVDSEEANVTGNDIGNDTLIDFEEITTGGGDDVFTFDASVGTLTINSGDGDDHFDFENASGDLVLSDTSGNDSLDFSDYDNALNAGINLDASNFDVEQDLIGNGSFNLTISGTNSTFNTITGTQYSDTIIGVTNEVNTIFGGDGSDTITGGDEDDILDGGTSSENDTIDGGAGEESLDYSARSNAATVILLGDDEEGSIDVDGTELDTLINIENITTDAGDDTFFIGDDGDNTIDAGAGTNDVVNVSGASGEIRVTYDGVNTTTVTGTSGVGEDTYINVEQVNVSGSDGSDDTFIVTDSRDNQIDGQGGTDTISYQAITSDFLVDIDDNSADIINGDIGNDTLVSIEAITTGEGDDTFTFTGVLDTDYILNSFTGSDIFEFGDSSTVEGTLTLSTSDSAALDFSGFTGSGISIDLSSTGSQNVTSDLNITLGAGNTFNIISGSSGADTITGSTVNDTIWAGAGDDDIDGGAGDDDLVNDALEGNDLVVTLNGSIDGSIVDATDSETDTIVNVENVTTGDGNDTFFVNDSQDNTIDAGDDIGGDDIVTVLGVTGVVEVTRSGGGTGADVTVSGTSTGNDEYINVELINVSGSDGSDETFIITDGLDNIINGGSNGTDGDTIDYSFVTASITVDVMASGIDVTSADTGNDTLNDIENVSTGSGDDTFNIEADTIENTFDANGGTDTAEFNVNGSITSTVGAEGVDVELTSTETDTLIDFETINYTGDTGDDTFVVLDGVTSTIDGGNEGSNGDTYDASLATDSVTVTETGANDFTITGTDTGNDTLIDVENITTGSGDDTVIVDNGTSNVYDGGSEATTAGDTYDISSANNIVTISQTAGTGSFDVSGSGNIGEDTLINFETIVTGASDDIFIIDTDIGGTFFFDAGGSTVGNTFQIVGTGSVETTITITTSSSTTDTIDFSGFTSGTGIDIDLSDTSEQDVATGTAGVNITLNGSVANVVGTNDADNITGTSGNNSIEGGGGNDTIAGLAGEDTLIGGADDDTIDGGADADTIEGGTGLDVISGSGGDDSISGGDDNDTIDGGDGADTIEGDSGDDTIIGSTGADSIAGGETGETNGDLITFEDLGTAIDIDLDAETNNVGGDAQIVEDVEDVIGSNMDDTIVGNDDDNTLQGGDGNDTISGGGGDDTLDGQGGTGDVVDYSNASNGVEVDLENGEADDDGDGGSDTLAGFEVISGTDNADIITGTDANGEIIYGGDGDDTINGLGGDDTIYGGSGSDAISGSDGEDVIYGGTHDGTNDTGTDDIYGGADDDTIYGGNDNTGGGSGTDGNDNIYGESGSDTVYGGNNNTDGGSGSDGSDTIEGGEGDDTLFGGNDNTNGGSGSDSGDQVTDTTNTANDTDTVVGDNNNQTGGMSGVSGTGTGGADTINVEDDGNTDGPDTVVGDNLTTNDSTDDTPGDTTTEDTNDTIDDGDGDGTP